MIATAVCRRAGAWRLRMDLMDLMDLMDKVGAPRYTPWVCLPLCGVARGQIYRRGMLGNLMAAAACSLRGRDACV